MLLNDRSAVVPFVLPEYREETGPRDLAVQHKPRLPEKGASMEQLSDNQRGIVASSERETPPIEGSSRTRVEQLRQLVVEIQREIAESDPTATLADGAFMREMLDVVPVTNQEVHYGDDHHSVSMTLPPPYAEHRRQD
ncbi:hypothetical protein C0991_003055 [Blastosporella zonata]|nr:hypothetical protein C0991_003055 [Blastosporella zonata]